MLNYANSFSSFLTSVARRPTMYTHQQLAISNSFSQCFWCSLYVTRDVARAQWTMYIGISGSLTNNLQTETCVSLPSVNGSHNSLAIENLSIDQRESQLGNIGIVANRASSRAGLPRSDDKLPVDFVLVYEPDPGRGDKENKRKFFESNLAYAGLVLREDNRDNATDDRNNIAVDRGQNIDRKTFVTIRAPVGVLLERAEKLNLKVPLRLNTNCPLVNKEDDKEGREAESAITHSWRLLFKMADLFRRRVQVAADQAAAVSYLTVHDASRGDDTKCTVNWPFTLKRATMYELGENGAHFAPTQRLEIIWNILQQTRNDPQDEKRRGVERLLEEGVYEDAFAVHDGQCDECAGERARLASVWASWGSVHRRQPLLIIRNYFGEKVCFYWAFLGFFTTALLFPSIVGLLAFLYGLRSMVSNAIVLDICDTARSPGNYVMCPLCAPPNCRFTLLGEGCEEARWDYGMDSEATVAVAALAAVWSTCLLKMWKRREARLAYQWDTYDVELEDTAIRPAYEERASQKRRDPVTGEMEPYVPPLRKAGRVLASVGATVLVLCLAGASLASLVLVRVSLYGALLPLVGDDNVRCSRWIVHGLIFVVVFIFENLYRRVAGKLATFECPRTREAWLRSLLWKVFAVQLVINFLPIAYAAWIKGKWISTPLDLDWRSEVCDTGGCMGEVTELTAVLLSLRLVVGKVVKIAGTLRGRLIRPRSEATPSADCQWRVDYQLNESRLDCVAEEYMELVMQLAFCTLFVAAFPLGPFICLVNNAVDIRLNAINRVRQYRRPLPVRVAGIQIWNDMLSIVSKLSIICGAGLIAFTSTVLPRLYYKHAVNPSGGYDDYTAFSVSVIHHSDWHHQQSASRNLSSTRCYYEDQRSDRFPYERVQQWWEVTCVRLAAFCVFVLAGFAFDWLFNFLVDDVPSNVALGIQRKRYFVTKAIEAHDEDKRAKQALPKWMAAAAAGHLRRNGHQ